MCGRRPYTQGSAGRAISAGSKEVFEEEARRTTKKEKEIIRASMRREREPEPGVSGDHYRID